MPLKEIKSKPEGGKPKLMDKAAKIPKTAAKDLWLKSKEKSISEIKETPFTGQRGESSNAPANNAGDQILSGAETTAREGASLTYRGGKKLAQATARKIKEKQDFSRTLSEAKHATGKTMDAAQSAASKIRTKHAAVRTVKGKPQKVVKTADRSLKSLKQSVKGIKTAQRSAKAAQQADKAAQKTAQATAKSAKASAQAAKAAARATVTGVKAAIHVTVTAVKTTIAAVKGLIAAIAAGGWVAVVIILLICLIALVVGSCFGIFFSGEDSGNGMTMPSVVQEISLDYQNRLNETESAQSYDVLEVSGSRAVWPEVLAVYSVKTATDPTGAQEVATMDEAKKKILTDIFWQMNVISSKMDTKTEKVIVKTDDGNGNITETESTVTRKYLHITVDHKTALEMADEYGFDENQRRQLAELLSDENKELWTQVLYGITGGGSDIVSVALSQVGNVGGETYWSWYGFNEHVDWCACFVSWCANACGYIDAGVMPKFASCTSGGMAWFKEHGQWQERDYIPNPGDIIFFDWASNGLAGDADHVGIVEKVENGRIYTIEGNADDSVRQNSYPVGYLEIGGFGCSTY